MLSKRRKYGIGGLIIIASITTALLLPSIISGPTAPSVTYLGHTNKAVVMLGVSSMTEQIEAQLTVSTSSIIWVEDPARVLTGSSYDGMILIDGVWIGEQKGEMLDKVIDTIAIAVSNGIPVAILNGNNDVLKEAAKKLEKSYGGSFTPDNHSTSSYGLFIDPITNESYPFQIGFAENKDFGYIVAESTAQTYYWCDEKIDEKKWSES